MIAIRTDNIHKTGLTEADVVRRARALIAAAPYKMSLQNAVDAVIDAAIERNQGAVK